MKYKFITEIFSESPIRLVVSDLDGTLLDDEKRISKRTLAAIGGLQKAGILFSVCTGREYAMLDHYAGLIQPTAPMVCNNGAEVIQYPAGQVISRTALPPQESRDFLCFCFTHGIDFCATTPQRAYFPLQSRMTPFYEQYERLAYEENLTPFPIARIESIAPLQGECINKIILRQDFAGTDSALQYLRHHSDIFDITTSSEMIKEVIPKGMSKAVGLARLCRFLGISPQQCCAVGDYENDIEMLSLVGVSVAMGNAEERVKQAAKYVTSSNEEDGVALLLEKILLG